LVVVLAPDGEVEFVNRHGLEFFGQSLEELKHWGTNGAIHPEDLPRLIEHFTQAIASGLPFEWELRGRRSDGVYRWFQSRGHPLREASGRLRSEETSTRIVERIQARSGSLSGLNLSESIGPPFVRPLQVPHEQLHELIYESPAFDILRSFDDAVVNGRVSRRRHHPHRKLDVWHALR
jgi:PAS domain S-box-containing protein